MRSNSVLVRMPNSLISSRVIGGALFAFGAFLSLASVSQAEPSMKEAIPACRIDVPHEVREATFVVVYKFEMRDGKPVNIRKVKNDFLKNDEFTTCISKWTIPSLAEEGVAEFHYKMGDGWTDMIISGKGFKRSIPLAISPMTK